MTKRKMMKIKTAIQIQDSDDVVAGTKGVGSAKFEQLSLALSCSLVKLVGLVLIMLFIDSHIVVLLHPGLLKSGGIKSTFGSVQGIYQQLSGIDPILGLV